MSDADAARLNTARGNVIKELIATERDYVNDLDVIVKVFIEPLREQALMNEKEILGVFLNVELLVAVNRELLAQLESAIALCPDEPHKCLVGKPLKQMAPYMKMYSSYCNNQLSAMELLQSITDERFEVHEFLEEALRRKECKLLDLGSFLVKPLQRVCKYPLLLREILKSTSESHPDYAELKLASDSICASVAILNEQKREQEKSLELLRIQNSIECKEKESIVILAPTRQLLEEADIIYISTKFKYTKAHYFLFNDLLVVVKRPRAGKYKLIAGVPLEQALVNHVSVEGVPFAVEVIHAGLQKLWLGVKTEEEKQHLTEVLSNIVDKKLDDLCKAEQRKTMQPSSGSAHNSPPPADWRDRYAVKPVPRPPGETDANGTLRRARVSSMPPMKAPPLPSSPRSSPSPSPSPSPSLNHSPSSVASRSAASPTVGPTKSPSSAEERRAHRMTMGPLPAPPRKDTASASSSPATPLRSTPALPPKPASLNSPTAPRAAPTPSPRGPGSPLASHPTSSTAPSAASPLSPRSTSSPRSTPSSSSPATRTAATTPTPSSSSPAARTAATTPTASPARPVSSTPSSRPIPSPSGTLRGASHASPASSSSPSSSVAAIDGAGARSTLRGGSGIKTPPAPTKPVPAPPTPTAPKPARPVSMSTKPMPVAPSSAPPFTFVVHRGATSIPIVVPKSSINFNLLRTRICRAAGIFTFTLTSDAGAPIASDAELQAVLRQLPADAAQLSVRVLER